MHLNLLPKIFCVSPLWGILVGTVGKMLGLAVGLNLFIDFEPTFTSVKKCAAKCLLHTFVLSWFLIFFVRFHPSLALMISCHSSLNFWLDGRLWKLTPLLLLETLWQFAMSQLYTIFGNIRLLKWTLVSGITQDLNGTRGKRVWRNERRTRTSLDGNMKDGCRTSVQA